MSKLDLMKTLLATLIMLIVFISFKNPEMEKKENLKKAKFEEIIKESYELSKPAGNIKKVLVLFGGFPENAAEIKREFKIHELAKQNNLAVLYMNYNQKLWLEQTEKQKLAEQLQSIFKENKLPTNDIYLGGFSSGGNVALLMASYLTANKNYKFATNGVFIIDSPIDLVALYKSSEKNVERRFSETSVTESTWIIETLGKQFGKPEDDISKYQKYAVYTSKTENIDNLKDLKNIKIRLYTEPDTLWWQENRKVDYEQMNAFYIKKLYESLKKSEFKRVQYIPTENKGFRANGDRHPHSWSIVDKNELMKWIMK
jgi:Lipase (class 3)